jgi:Uma2 family endonuclease
MSTTKLYTADDLLALDADASFELIAGELREVPSPGAHSSGIAINLIEALRAFLRRTKMGYLTGEAGGYVLATDPDTVLMPDVSYIRRDLLPDGLPDGYVQVPPDLAIEVMSPSNRIPELERKAQRYLMAGTRLVWIVRPDNQTVTVYRPDRPAIVLGLDDMIDGADVLPVFRMSVGDVFRDPLES